VTFRELLSTLWRRKLIIIVSIVVCVAAAFAYSKLRSPTYQSTVLIEMASSTSTSGSGTTGASPVTLPDPVQTLGSTAVELGAAKILKDPDVSAVSSSVTGTVDPTSGALSIVATGTTPQRAQAVAAAYASSFDAQIAAVVQGQINKINDNVAQLQTTIANLEAQPASSANSAQITALSGAVSTQLTNKYNIQAEEPFSSVQVQATLPTAPTGLGKSKLVGIGFIAGLLVGIGIALVREQFDNRLRTSPDIESVTSAPILAEIPHDSEVRSGKIAIALVQAPQSQVAESIRELRTSLRVIFEDSPCPMIVVTSPEPGDGKTFVAANLATAWAMSGSKVIAVSADFRRPRLEEIFGLQATGLPGLADLIRSNWKNPDPAARPVAPREMPIGGSADSERTRNANFRGAGPSRSHRESGDDLEQTSVKSLLVETGIWGLQVLPAGTQLDSPSELFGSPGMQPVLDQLPLLADVIVFDTPPVLPVPDTAIIGRMASGTVVVASEGRTDRHDLERTVNRLEATQCRVLGLALNRVRRASSDTYQSYAFKQ
jgi:Mrp family chromosome partitioning ATPase/LPS O-antigen subunit length determinant protein (WzzB/FepE family)